MNLLQNLKKKFSAVEMKKRELQAVSSTAQRLAKQSIFSVHREELVKAGKLLKEATIKLAKGKNILNVYPGLDNEGMWQSALEEFYEAKFFLNAARNQPLFISKDIHEEPLIILGALSDLTGEMARLAVRKATLGDKTSVDRLFKLAENLVAFLISLDSTGYLRTKTDQAKQHLRRLEELRYDISKK